MKTLIKTTNSTDLLTNREMQLVRLLGKGHARNEIASKMDISLHTYDSYRKNIRNKLNIKNQADWAMLLMQIKQIEYNF